MKLYPETLPVQHQCAPHYFVAFVVPQMIHVYNGNHTKTYCTVYRVMKLQVPWWFRAAAVGSNGGNRSLNVYVYGKDRGKNEGWTTESGKSAIK